MGSFEQGFVSVAQGAGSFLGAMDAARYAQAVDAALEIAIEELNSTAARHANNTADQLKGWLAEQWHASTLRVRAVAMNRPDVWAQVPNDRSPIDLRFGDRSGQSQAQVKYYATGQQTAKQISRPDYTGTEKIVPADQLRTVRETASREAVRNETTRPEVAANYRDTAENASDRARVGRTESKPLGEPTSKEMATDYQRSGKIDGEKFGLVSENFVEWSDVLRQGGQAALSAAIMSAALSAAPHMYKLISKYMESGGVTAQDWAELGMTVVKGAGTGAFRGGVAATLTAAAKTGLLGSALKKVSPSAVGAATALTLNAVGHALNLYRGTITRSEFAHHCMRDAFVVSSGVAGAGLGQMFIPVPLVGMLVGNVVGSMVGAVFFSGVHRGLLGLCVENGWTFFGLVDHNYRVPESVLRQAGFDLFVMPQFLTETFLGTSFHEDTFAPSMWDFVPVRRGVIGFNTIGFLTG